MGRIIRRALGIAAALFVALSFTSYGTVVRAEDEDLSPDTDTELISGGSQDYLAPGDPGIVINISYFDEEGTTPLALTSDFYTYDTLTLMKDDSVTSYDIKAEFDNGQTVTVTRSVTRTYDLCRILGLSAEADGATSVKFTLTGFEGTIEIRQPSARDFSGIEVTGTNPDGTSAFDNEWESKPYRSNDAALSTGAVTTAAGQVFNIKYTAPLTCNGTISFDSFDGSVTGDYSYYFAMDFSGTTNFNMDDFYWTFDSDAAGQQHRPSVDAYGGRHCIIEVPLSDSVTLHNIPLGCTYMHYMPPCTLVENNGQGVKYSGNPLTSSDITDRGLAPYLTYEVERGTGYDPNYGIQIIMSGYIGNWNVGDGFKMKVHIMRSEAQILFSKMYDNTDPYCDPSAVHNFRVTLTDTLTGAPYADKDVAYCLYTGFYDTFDKTVSLGHTNSSGELYIDVPAGNYVRLGRAVPRGYSSTAELYCGEIGSYADNYEYINSFFPELGMLPDGIHYVIEEIAGDYTAAISGNAEATVHNTTGTDWPLDENDPRWYTPSVLHNIIEYACGIIPPEFTNSRTLGSLEVKKTLTGSSSDSAFRFSVTFSDTNGIFPSDLPCTYPDGSAGALAVSAGSAAGTYVVTFDLKKDETMRISGIPSGVTYKVEEDAASSDGFDVAYTNGSGTVDGGVTEVSVNNSKESQYVPATGEDVSYHVAFAMVFAAAGCALSVVVVRRRTATPNCR